MQAIKMPVSPDLSCHLPELSAFLEDSRQRQSWFCFPPVRCYLRKGIRRITPPGDNTATMRLLELATVDVDPEAQGMGWGHAFVRLLVSTGAPVYVENVLSERLDHLLSEHGFIRLDTDRIAMMSDHVLLQGDERLISSRILDAMSRQVK